MGASHHFLPLHPFQRVEMVHVSCISMLSFFDPNSSMLVEWKYGSVVITQVDVACHQTLLENPHHLGEEVMNMPSLSPTPSG